MRKPAFRGRGQEYRVGTCEQRGTLVDLVERIRRDDARLAGPIAHAFVQGFVLQHPALTLGAFEDALVQGSQGVERRDAGRRGQPLARFDSSFLLGLFTQLSNPTTAVVYGSIFAALLPHDLPLSAALVLPFLVFLVEAGWYSIVALALSTESSRGAYLRSKMHVDRIAGGVMGLLGLKLVVAARPVA